MVDWNSQEVLKICSFVFKQSIAFLFGLYGWDFILSFPYLELRLLLGILRFRWIFLFYLFGRYVWLFELMALVIITRTELVLNCSVTFKLMSVFGTMTVSCASTNLLIRTVTIWHKNSAVKALLILMSVGHWTTAIVVGSAGDRSVRNPMTQKCQFVYPKGEIIAFYAYTVVLDFVILVLTTVGLVRHHVIYSMGLWRRVYAQGILYFVTAFIVNVPTLIFAWLSLNSVLTVIFSIPAATLSTIASSRAVTSLLHSVDTDETNVSIEDGSGGQRRRISEKGSSNSNQLTTNINITELIGHDSEEAEEQII